MQENLSMSEKIKEARHYNLDTRIHTDTVHGSIPKLQSGVFGLERFSRGS